MHGIRDNSTEIFHFFVFIIEINPEHHQKSILIFEKLISASLHPTWRLRFVLDVPRYYIRQQQFLPQPCKPLSRSLWQWYLQLLILSQKIIFVLFLFFRNWFAVYFLIVGRDVSFNAVNASNDEME